jgi:hypothetical protein
LEAYDCEDEVFCKWFGAAELENLFIALLEDDRLSRLELSRHTSGCALIIACRLVLCGSSVYVQKNASWPGTDFSSSLVAVSVVVEDIVCGEKL